MLKHHRLGGSGIGSPAGPGDPEGQRQQCQSQRLPRGPGALHSPAHAPGASPSSKQTVTAGFLAKAFFIQLVLKKLYYHPAQYSTR